MSNNKIPKLPVDFGNCDVDGSVRLITRGTVDAIEKASIRLQDGLEVVLTDGEITAAGLVYFRDGMWVAEIREWQK
jgi:uncharacterized protein YwbE